ncbi:uncharacterized protein LOC135466512 [Liolophura sinensis]|uniref:uncharacterized protein LOC135466512 n=1 Tax=Liolophura sinensis TaxID=3198878 RepID=UPI00315847C3
MAGIEQGTLEKLMKSRHIDCSKSVALTDLPEDTREADIKERVEELYGTTSKVIHVPGVVPTFLVEFASQDTMLRVGHAMLFREKEVTVNQLPLPHPLVENISASGQPGSVDKGGISKYVQEELAKQKSWISRDVQEELAKQKSWISRDVQEELAKQKSGMLDLLQRNNELLMRQITELMKNACLVASSEKAPVMPNIQPTTPTPPVVADGQPLASAPTPAPEVLRQKTSYVTAAHVHSAAATPVDQHTSSAHSPMQAPQGSQQMPIFWERPSPHFYRVKPFSGTYPVKSGESSLEEWCQQMRIIQDDQTLTASSKRQRLMSSLLSPALDMVLGLGENKQPDEMISYLRRLYRGKKDDVLTWKQFFSLTPTPSELPSEYLIRLEVELQKLRLSKPMSQTEVDQTRLTQFRTTNRNPNVYSILNARFQTGASPSLPELMDAVRDVEKDDVVFPTQAKARNHVHNTSETVESGSSELHDLKADIQKIFSLVSQTHSLTKQPDQDHLVRNKEQEPKKNGQKTTKFCRFCHNCGQWDHSRPRCRNSPNQALVWQRTKEGDDFYTQIRQTKSNSTSADLNSEGSLRH